LNLKEFSEFSLYGEVQREEVLAGGDQHHTGHHRPADAGTLGVQYSFQMKRKLVMSPHSLFLTYPVFWRRILLIGSDLLGVGFIPLLAGLTPDGWDGVCRCAWGKESLLGEGGDGLWHF
jgi:hypothetical protein